MSISAFLFNYINEIPNGWSKGRIVKGFFITNGIESKLINSEDEIPTGWRKGRLKRTKEQIKNNYIHRIA